MIYGSTRVLFLDFDGVLNFIDMHSQPHSLDRGCVAHLNRIVEQGRADVVISSSHRLRYSIEELAERLGECGFVGHVVGKTERDVRPFWRERGLELDRMERGHQIAEYILRHPRIEAAVILDDDRDMWLLGPLLVHTSDRTGLTDADVDRALTILNIDRDPAFPNGDSTLIEALRKTYRRPTRVPVVRR